MDLYDYDSRLFKKSAFNVMIIRKKMYICSCRKENANTILYEN